MFYISHRVKCHRQKSTVEEVDLNLNTKGRLWGKILEQVKKNTSKFGCRQTFLKKD